jgi:subtilisin family serine protease
MCLAIAPAGLLAGSSPPGSADDLKRAYIVIFDDPPLAAYDGRELPGLSPGDAAVRLQATARAYTGTAKLDVNSSVSRRYLQFLDRRFLEFGEQARLRIGRSLEVIHRYRNASNGFATHLTAAEAAVLRELPGVHSVQPDFMQKINTDSGPAWIGADKIHAGQAGYPPRGGEGIVAGIFDTGINWDHPSFSDPGQGMPANGGDWDHVNPYGTQLGLCYKSQVRCNDKLVGVYDFVVDDPNTPVTEEYTDGKDNIGHGSHVASVVAGNPGYDFAPLGGVAPNANIISYRVCFEGDPGDPDDDGCQGSAILSAIDQALADGVDVVNHSIGGEATDPWQPFSSAYGFLNLRAAGTFVATSSGNAGPEPGTIGAPANAPWLMSVGAATHDRMFTSVLENLAGGSGTPPADLYGASLTGGIGIRKIVHAKDYGNALCGTGDPELQPNCAGNTGVQSNPFAPGTFKGEIVVCDRGTYGRVEKGKNLLRAGAGGYILANTADSPQTVVADEHCLPAVHLNRQDGDVLRSWLNSGSGHQGSISGATLLHLPDAGDVMAAFSSRGPNGPYAADLMKPELIAPGVDILGASGSGDGFYFANGTSFSSPHVAGAAALIKSVHPDWSPSQLMSALILTATPEMAIDYDGSEATVHERGAGRPRLDLAVNAGLYLEETRDRFIAADPASGGQTQSLNLPGLVDTSCLSCRFERTVTDMAGGASWSSSVSGFPEGVAALVTPGQFTLTEGSSQRLTIDIDVQDSSLIGEWVFGDIVLSSSGKPDAVLPVAVLANGFADQWVIETDQASGWQSFNLTALQEMPDATITSAGLVEPQISRANLRQDVTRDDPYDNLGSVWVSWFDVPEGTLLLRAETLPSTAVDLDLYVGRDGNNNSQVEAYEEICDSHSPSDTEKCDLIAPAPGRYWVLVQNWASGSTRDEVELKTALVGNDSSAPLQATSDGIVAAGERYPVRLSWDNVGALPGTELLGAVGFGTSRNQPTDIGVIPVTFSKTGIAPVETLVLMNGVRRSFSLPAATTHDRIVLDVPPGTGSMTIQAFASDADQAQNQALEMTLYRSDFDAAMAGAPFASAADMNGQILGQASGSPVAGPRLTLGSDQAESGRWSIVLRNKSLFDLDVEIQATLELSGDPIALNQGLWQPSSRPELSQGFDYSSTGDYRALLWYTYDETGLPAWYLAAGPEPEGNVWVAELSRFTNDGSQQKSSPVGHVSVTALSPQDSIFSFVLFGEEGSDRMVPSSPQTCPGEESDRRSYTGLWSRAETGVGGASVLVNDSAQGYLHYIYDASGNPAWLLGASDNSGLPDAQASLQQFQGYCAVCTGAPPTSREVGLFTINYTDENHAGWNLDYLLAPPLGGSVNRDDSVEKLTLPVTCQ